VLRRGDRREGDGEGVVSESGEDRGEGREEESN
jgi:hypothetical protein